MPLIGGFAWSNHTARTISLARPEDTKNDWSSQSLLMPLSIVLISRGICKLPWPMGSDTASLTSTVHTATNACCWAVTRRRNSRFASPVFAAFRAGCKPCSAQLRLPKLRHATDVIPGSTRSLAGEQQVLLIWAAIQKLHTTAPQMRARAPSADGALGIQVHVSKQMMTAL
jgi:hypothetical protein